MIRKYIVAVLTLAAVGVVIIAAVSDTGHVRTPLWQVGNWRFCLYARDTIASVFWFKQHEPMTLDFRSAQWGETLLFEASSGAKYDKLYYRNCELLRSTRVRNRKAYVPYHGISTTYLIARGMRRPAVTVTAIHSSMWTLLALLLAYPHRLSSALCAVCIEGDENGGFIGEGCATNVDMIWQETNPECARSAGQRWYVHNLQGHHRGVGNSSRIGCVTDPALMFPFCPTSSEPNSSKKANLRLW